MNDRTREDDFLLELSGAIADGETIDWESIEASAPSDEALARIRRLQLVEQVVHTHGALEPEGEREDAPDLPAGSRVGHYEVVGHLGRGGMGVVYRARDLVLQREVALKTPLLRGEHKPAQRERFLREARSTSRLAHPGIVPVFEAFEHEGRPWIAMELVEGDNLHGLLQRGKRFELEVLLRHLESLADALAAAHEAGILHRDIKPSNVIVGRDGRSRLTDFGLARHRVAGRSPASESSTDPGSLTTRGVLIGTPAYMSPERLLGREVDGRSDIYSLGALFYEICTGQGVARATDRGEVIDKVLHEDPRPITEFVPELPAELDRIVRKCLRKEPDERYQNAGALRAELRSLRRSLDEITVPMRRPAPRRRRARRKLVLAIASVAFLVAVVTSWTYVRRPPPMGERVSVAVFPFVDSTGESDGALRATMVADLVAVNLESSRLLRAMGPHCLSTMVGRAVEPGAAPATTRALASAAAVDYVASGTLYKEDEAYVAIVQAEPIGDAERIPSFKHRAPSLDALAEKLAGELRRDLPGASTLLVLRDVAPGLADVTSASEEALLAFEEGRLARAEGRLGAAIERFEQAVRIDPEFCRGHVRLAEALREAGYGTRTRETAARALELRPPEDDPETRRLALLVTLIHARAFHRWEDAATAARRLVELEPDEPRAGVDLALALEDAGRTAEAIEEIGRAVELEPDNPRHRLVRAGLLARAEGRGEDALREARLAERLFASIESDEGVAAASAASGQAFFELGRYDEAVAAFDEALRRYEQIGREVLAAEAELGAALALTQQGHPTAAAERLDGAAEIARRAGSLVTLARARTRQGLAGFGSGAFGEAESSLREAIDLARRLDSDRLLWTPLFNLGSMLSYVGRLDEAEHLIEESIAAAGRLDKREWETVARLLGADIAYQRGELDDAIVAYRAVLESGAGRLPTEDTAWAHLGLAEILDRRGRYDEALVQAELGIDEFDVHSLPVLAGYGRARRAEILARLGRGDAANDELDTLAALLEEEDVLADLSGRVAVARAAVAFESGRYDDALAEARRALDQRLSVPAIEVPASVIASEAAVALGRVTEAVELGARAVTIDRAPPAETTHARVALAEALLAAGETERARQIAVVAREEAERMGLQRAGERARVLLERVETRPVPSQKRVGAGQESR